jgi:hypothetical protein
VANPSRPRLEITIFDLIFETRDDGTLTPRIPLRIVGRDFLPGASLGPDFRPFDIPMEEWHGQRIYGHHEGRVLVSDAVSRR